MKGRRKERSSSRAWDYKIALHPNEDVHYAGNRKKHFNLYNDSGLGLHFSVKSSNFNGSKHSWYTQFHSCAHTCHLIKPSWAVGQLLCYPSVLQNMWKAEKQCETARVHNKAIQKPEGKCGMSRRDCDICTYLLYWGKLLSDPPTTPSPWRGED